MATADQQKVDQLIERVKLRGKLDQNKLDAAFTDLQFTDEEISLFYEQCNVMNLELSEDEELKKAVDTLIKKINPG